MILLAAVGCGKTEVETKTENTEKPLSLEDSVVGSYETKGGKQTWKYVFLENRKFEIHKNGEKKAEGTWKIDGKEVHFGGENYVDVCKVESNGNLTMIAEIHKGIRTDFPKEAQATFKRIK